MVKIVAEDCMLFAVCEECGLAYPSKETAEKCEMWCGKHQTCNIEIIKSAVEIRRK